MTVSEKAKTKAPISSHPAFPAIVALWFAALLGIGSMVLPIVLFEKLSLGTGLASVLPAAQPPLGATARILIALVSAGIGVIAGLWIARKVVAAQTVEKPRKRAVGPADSPVKRPISAMDELGVERLDAALDHADRAPIAGRRRPLSLSDENGRSDFLESAPLPGHDPYAPPVAERDALDLSEYAEPEMVRVDGDDSIVDPIRSEPSEPEDAIDPQAPIHFGADESYGGQRQHFVPAEPVASPHSAPPPPSSEAAPIEPWAPSAETSMLHQQEDDPFGTSARAAIPADREAAAEHVAERPLGELGMVELVERFAMSLQRRAAGEAADEAPLSLPQFKVRRDAPQVEETETASDPAEAPAMHGALEHEELSDGAEHRSAPAPVIAPPPPAIPVPAALRPIACEEFDDAEEDDLAASATLALSLDPQARPFGRPVAVSEETPVPWALQPADRFAPADLEADEDDHTGESGGDQGEGYSSLLAMKSPLGGAREFVRIDDENAHDEIEPVVVFPGQQHQRRAAPASDGPSRGPLSDTPAQSAGLRPFDGPAVGQRATHGDFAAATPARVPGRRPDAGDTERALRDALEKLQRMSGAA